MKTQVIALTRRSRGEQQSQHSHEGQKRRIKEYCENNNLVPVLFFKEDDKGYKNELERPVLAEVISTINQNDDLAGIVIWRADRFARDPRLAYYIAETFARKGKRIWCVEDEAFGLNFREAQAIGMTPEEYMQSSMMTSMKLIFAEMEWITQFIRSEEGKTVSVHEGNPPYKPPRGYTRDEEGAVVLDIKEGAEVKAMFSDFMVLKNLTKIARRYKVPLATLRGILTNPFYTGWFRWRGQLHKGNYCPMMFKESFEEVQQILEKGAKTNVVRKEN